MLFSSGGIYMEQTPPAPNSGLPWTRSEDEKLVQLYNEHVTFSEIAAQLGRTKTALMLRIKILSFPFQEAQPEIPRERKAYSQWSEKELDHIVESYRQGISLAAVSLETGRTIENLCLQLAKLGVAQPQSLDLVTYQVAIEKPPKFGLKWTEEDRAELLTSFLNGATLKDLAKVQERTNWSVLSKLFEAGCLDESDLEEMYRRAQARAFADSHPPAVISKGIAQPHE